MIVITLVSCDQCTLTIFSTQHFMRDSSFLLISASSLNYVTYQFSQQGPVSDSPRTLSEDTFLSSSNFVFYFRFFFVSSNLLFIRSDFKNVIESHHHHQHGNGFKRKLARSVLVLPASTRMCLNVK